MRTIVVSTHLSTYSRRACCAAMVLGCLTIPAKAQESAGSPTAVAPVYKVGDTWIFLRGNGEAPPGEKLVQTVVSVTDDRTTFSDSINGGTPYEADCDNQGSSTRKGTSTYEPNIGWLRFPMTVGKSWDARYLLRYPGGSIDVIQHVEVVAFERVQVPAGSFDAYRLVVSGLRKSHVGGGRALHFSATYWYAPSVKLIFKTEYKSYPYGGIDTSTSELVAISLAP